MGRRALVTREQVLRTARAVFAQRGYEATTLTAIAAPLGISPAALLRHAPTKQALFELAMSSGEMEETVPIEFLRQVSLKEDPRKVLRRVAEAIVPFMNAKIGEHITRWQHAQTADDARAIAEELSHPFGGKPITPPQKALMLLEDYFMRARAAGVIRIEDPRVAAIIFLGSLQAYVFLHRVLRAVDPPVPLDHYLHQLLQVWTTGAIRRQTKKRSRKRKSS